MNEYEFEFTGKVEILDFGRMAYTVVYATKNIVSSTKLNQKPRLRIDGMVAGQPFHGAFQPTSQKRYYLILSKKFCKSAKINVGDRIQVGFNIADQNAIEVPRPLEFALNANDRARTIWESISAGKKRGLAYRVASAKRAETIENRIEEVIETLIAMDSSERTKALDRRR